MSDMFATLLLAFDVSQLSSEFVVAKIPDIFKLTSSSMGHC